MRHGRCPDILHCELCVAPNKRRYESMTRRTILQHHGETPSDTHSSFHRGHNPSSAATNGSKPKRIRSETRDLS